MAIEVAGLLSDQDEMEARLGVLVYSGRQGCLATIHRIEADPLGGPGVFLPGENMGLEHLQQLNENLNKREATRQILRPEILVADQDLVVWHKPAQRRVIFFETGTCLDELNGRMALHPALLFLARPNSLSVFALAGNERPDGKTPLYRAPYLNVYGGGAMCGGSARLPDNPSPSGKTIKAYEKAFFDSSFSHTASGDKELTSYSMGHAGLWRMLAASGHTFFPNWTLLRAKIGTVEATLQMAVEKKGGGI